MTIFEDMDRQLLSNFERTEISVKSGTIRALIGGSGPPVLMLHGDPQTHLCWHSIAPEITSHFTVVLTDLRGRGESHKPGRNANHRLYSKREMATEQMEVMGNLGFDRFALVGHDRGARVARRLALDHPDSVERLAVMDIVPALDFYEKTNAQIAQDYFYFFFLTQPEPFPERLITGDPTRFMREILTGLTGSDFKYDPGALDVYLHASTKKDAIIAMCECFRAGVSCDMEDDKADRASGRKIECPTLVFWGEKGVVGRHFDMRRIWRQWAKSVAFAPMPCGHFIPEEVPDLAARALLRFFK